MRGKAWQGKAGSMRDEARQGKARRPSQSTVHSPAQCSKSTGPLTNATALRLSVLLPPSLSVDLDLAFSPSALVVFYLRLCRQFSVPFARTRTELRAPLSVAPARRAESDVAFVAGLLAGGRAGSGRGGSSCSQSPGMRATNLGRRPGPGPNRVANRKPPNDFRFGALKLTTDIGSDPESVA
ncbi:hypothetical protein AXG93_1615s1070 [Marchantia polymorpha subsp. ruderalis]|uniref:Uncharacterized protein n=1 Tax=Marchantia polymorpha subsp. ruderalis TaxID=1480154 RepID=A0A176VUH8_MARPO|nr:hypothetical protein AXG93_1615s1070 [Marchantia polymorpha subsp. ruderalis]